MTSTTPSGAPAPISGVDGLPVHQDPSIGVDDADVAVAVAQVDALVAAGDLRGALAGLGTALGQCQTDAGVGLVAVRLEQLTNGAADGDALLGLVGRALDRVVGVDVERRLLRTLVTLHEKAAHL
jgi:hypothetical protein